MKNLLYPSLAMAAFGFATACPAAAQDRIGADRYAVTLREVDAHPATPDAARRTLARIGKAALAACGASSSNLREVNRSIARSACWRDSVADTVARIGDPLLTRVYDNGH